MSIAVPEAELPTALDEINLNSWRFWRAPAGERERCFLRLRRERPVSFHPTPTREREQMGNPSFWALTRHADILAVSRDPGLWSSAGGASIRDFPPRLAPYFRSMVNMDEPRHTRLRKIVSRGFTPGALAKLAEGVRRRVTGIIDDVIEKGECDFVAEIAAPLPLLVICDMMGIPESEAPFVFDCGNVVVGAADRSYFPAGADPLDVQVGAVEGLTALMKALAGHRLRSPGDDLITKLLRADIDGEALDEAELASFFVLLVSAGSETTRTAISQGMKALIEHPDERRRWARDFDRFAATAVEEILRWSSPVLHFRRTATRDTEIHGQPIAEGERVVLWYVSANRDEEVFEEPYRFDLARTPNEHVAFGGGGTHYCLGASLARREIALLFRELFERMPDLELSGAPEMHLSNFTNGIKSMPCRFTPGDRRLR